MVCVTTNYRAVELPDAGPGKSNVLRCLQQAIIQDYWMYSPKKPEPSPKNDERIDDAFIDHYFSNWDVQVLFCDSEVMCVDHTGAPIRAHERRIYPLIDTSRETEILVPLIWKVAYVAQGLQRTLICIQNYYVSSASHEGEAMHELSLFALMDTRAITTAVALALMPRYIGYLEHQVLVRNLRSLGIGMEYQVDCTKEGLYVTQAVLIFEKVNRKLFSCFFRGERGEELQIYMRYDKKYREERIGSREEERIRVISLGHFYYNLAERSVYAPSHTEEKEGYSVDFTQFPSDAISSIESLHVGGR